MTTDPESTPDVLSFWFWFENNLHRFEHLEDQQEVLLPELGEQLQEVDEGLTYEISMPDEEGVRDLVISADGVKEAFPAVMLLIDSAPDLPGWTFTPFRQRMDLAGCALQFGEQELTPDDFYFWLQTEDGAIDLIVYVPGLTEENREAMMGASFVLLDMTLGEFDVTLKIRYIDFQPLPENPEAEDLQPLSALPDEFDALFDALNPE
ncbi:MAG: hypothetical protein NXI29_10980 [bacterium]|uniref:DUF695 domain-containing protein n=1 Tax=Gimesia benthica TaxID=2608982 RepID=A0A6I6AFP7_9PLAN|nr:hypothetical protein [Gimesia benthica]MCR9231524.1 hypothetical protein [bacterium]QGQ23911.1 hypothetical protein F1728_15020 [Gimesia benthica]